MADLNAILDSIKELKLLEVAELVKMMEEEFGVSAAAPVMVAAAADGAAAGGAAEQSEFEVVLADAGASKLNVI
ncbi:MAG: 50S ribosomal protein L7/L12, partial [Ruminococcus sp.]|nr:50S ribosomal protein L7/L12 [Ruminococcus sp.]